MEQTLAFTYDDDGNLLTASSSNGTTTYTYTMTYDDAGRVVTAVDPFGLTLTFGYDADGNQTSVTDWLGGVVTSTYDGDRLVERTFSGTGVTPLRIDLSYNSAGLLASLTRFSNLTGTTQIGSTTYSYDAADQLIDLVDEDGSGTNIAEYTYAYDEAGQVTSETIDGGTPTDYSYDATGQLIGDGGTSVSYDLTGNRAATGYSTNADNQLLSDGTWNYSYDADGNLIKKTWIGGGETWTYGYDERNQLIWVQQRATDGGTLEMSAAYTYDAFGNRIIKDVTYSASVGPSLETVARYALDGWNPAKGTPVGTENWDVWAELDGSSSLITRYLQGDVVDQVFAQESASGTASWYLTDRLGSVVGLTDATGALQETFAYDAFGNVTAYGTVGTPGPVALTNGYYWEGLQRDVETGLQYNRARYYDSATGRWISQDPLGFDAKKKRCQDPIDT